MNTGFWQLTIGNVVEIAAMIAGGATALVSIGKQIGKVLSRLGALESGMDGVNRRVQDLEYQNTLPIGERRVIRHRQ